MVEKTAVWTVPMKAVRLDSSMADSTAAEKVVEMVLPTAVGLDGG
jgi:hypothetical protein